MKLTQEHIIALHELYLGVAKEVDAEILEFLHDKHLISSQYSLEQPYIITEIGISELVEEEVLIDMFEHISALNEDFQKVVYKWGQIIEDHNRKENLDTFLKECEMHGYTFSYGRSLEPMHLVSLPAK